jgi:hypothetical protein
MMSSENKKKAEMIIHDLLRMIDEQYIEKRINQPVNKAALNFSFSQPETITHQLFNDIISDFVIHLFNKGYSSKISSKTIAMAEAVAILDMGYQGSSNGYNSAFIDSMNPETNGLEIVLQQIKEIIITVLQKNHIKWVYDTYITPLGWPLKTIIAEILFDQWKLYLPLSMQKISPIQMVDCIPELINAIQTSDDKVRKSTGSIF